MPDWRVAVGDVETSAIFEPAAADRSGAVFVCAHGAGGHRSDRGMARLARALGAAGFDMVRFNFLYTEKRSRRVDPMPALQACVAAVVAHARRELQPRKLVIGGRSMGGRAASMLAAEGFECDGLLLAAYPLHPVGKPEKLRAAHLSQIRVPVLCLNGTRDDLCGRDLMDRALEGASWQVHWIEGADHFFHVLKSSGRTDDDVFDEIETASRRWLSRLDAQAPRIPARGD